MREDSKRREICTIYLCIYVDDIYIDTDTYTTDTNTDADIYSMCVFAYVFVYYLCAIMRGLELI